jgi:hypothetical protein
MVSVRGGTPRAQINDYARKMQRIGRSHVRGVLFSLNGVAKYAKELMVDELRSNRIIDQPSPFTMRGLRNQFTSLKTDTLNGVLRDRVSSAIYIADQQSTYMKYLFGTGQNTRYPGDVGPADKKIFQPIWANLARYEGVNPLYGGGIPRNTLKSMARRAGNPILEADGTVRSVGSRSTTTRDRRKNGLFWGAPTFGGVKSQPGIWSRGRKVNGRWDRGPRLLIAFTDKARYEPIMQAPWDAINARAMAEFPNFLTQELRKNIMHARTRSGFTGTYSEFWDWVRDR